MGWGWESGGVDTWNRVSSAKRHHIALLLGVICSSVYPLYLSVTLTQLDSSWLNVGVCFFPSQSHHQVRIPKCAQQHHQPCTSSVTPLLDYTSCSDEHHSTHSLLQCSTLCPPARVDCLTPATSQTQILLSLSLSADFCTSHFFTSWVPAPSLHAWPSHPLILSLYMPASIAISSPSSSFSSPTPSFPVLKPYFFYSSVSLPSLPPAFTRQQQYGQIFTLSSCRYTLHFTYKAWL